MRIPADVSVFSVANLTNLPLFSLRETASSVFTDAVIAVHALFVEHI
jgi:hypothetical protein